jgi:hypothetical protein
VAALLMGATVLRAASVTLTNSDALGSTSFNTALNWSNGQAPGAGNDYSTGAFILRTPANASSFTFQGASLTVNTNGNLYYKGTGSSGTITINNLIMAGGTNIHNQGTVDFYRLAGNLNVAADSVIYAKQGPVIISALVAGNGKVVNPGSDCATCVLTISNSVNTYTGSIVNNGRLVLAAGANLNFVIGASGVNNRVSGMGPQTTFNGRFVFDLSAASTNIGDSWTIASASSQSFGSTFSVDGFSRQGGGTGAGLWDYDAGGFYYEFETASGMLRVVATPSTPPGPPGLTGVPVTYIPVDDGNTNTSEYGYAGDNDDPINAVAFICSGLITVSNQQFITYYGRHETDASYAFNNTVWVGRRTLGSNLWEVFRTTFTAADITDGHDVISAGIDGEGYLHISWGMHGNSFRYAKSTAPVTGTNAIAFGAATTQTGFETNVTYPQFLTMPNGDLLFLFRQGTSGAGDTYINRYRLSTHTWTNQQFSGGTIQPLIKGTWPGGDSVDYNAYPNLPCLNANGNLFLIWTWRTTSAYQSNHDFAYAHSADGGVTWQRSDNSAYTLPINQNGENGNTNSIAEKILNIPVNSSLINQAGMCLDGNNDPVIATWWAPGAPGNQRRQYMVAFPNSNGVWQVRQVSNRTNDPIGTIQPDSAVRDLGRPVVVADKDNRILVLYRDNFGSNGLTVAHSLPYAVDPLRTNWTTIDLTYDNLGAYEPVIDLARWQRDNVLSIFYQPSTGHGYTAPANTASQVAVVEWDAAAYFQHRPPLQMAFTNANQDVVLSWPSQTGWGYKIQTSTNMTSWTDLGTLTGNQSIRQFIQTNATAVPARFWRLEVKEGGF